ncbi:FG-GAP repeat protein [Engelhardtia mirabilis]|uniref:Cortical protein marker for cell polarity n=1 Tax=Engelhardtia mirabilis TaxID=2528011 RepID=A0A518BMS0_9BACT|nr:hypothetical protein Pla133_33740 [Planctomycetes bacterium Pla133]QDV02604.1 hypothetical protein Pla86_33730 [Planctomycetes bacterium Pla86]
MIRHRILLAVAALGCTSLARAQGGLDWNLQAGLAPPGLNLNALFGTALELDDGLLVVGSNGKQNVGSSPDGAVFTWRRTAGGWWEPLPLLTPPIAGLGGNFGRGLSLSGERLLVGAPLEDAGGVNASGAAHLYDLDPGGGGWQLAASFAPAAAAPADNYGFTVTLDGDRCAVMPKSNGFPASAPMLLFRRSSTGEWVSDGQIPKPPTVGASGWSASLSGDLIAVPYESADGVTPDSGVVEIHRRGSSGWTLEATLAPSDGPAFGTFGRSVSLDGTRVAIGRGSHGVLGPAYIYVRDGAGNWTLEQQLVPTDPVLGLGFGFSIDLKGDRLAVGSHMIGIAPHPGSAHVYRLQAGSWQLESIVEGETVPPVVTLEGVARDVAIDATSVALGAGQSDIQINPFSVQSRGAAFVYEPSGSQSLEAHPVLLHLWAGGTQQLALDFGSSAAGQLYIVLGSISGTTPGLSVDGLLLELVPDGYTNTTLVAPNTAPLGATFGALDGSGRGLATFSIPPNAPPSLAGLVLHHAAVVLDTSGPVSVSAVSPPSPLQLVP